MNNDLGQVGVQTRKSSARQWLVHVQGIAGFFQTKSGGDLSVSVTKVYDGGSLVADLLPGVPDYANITVSRAYDHDRDAAMLARMREGIGSIEKLISVTPLTRDMSAQKKYVVNYPNCLLVGVQEPQSDSSSGDASTFTLEFAVRKAVAGVSS